jgi:hypothetical protein
MELMSVIFSNDVITFWDIMLFFFIWIPLLMIWVFCFFDVFRREDLGGGMKALWVVVIIILPWIGALIYLITRPREPAYPSYPTSSGP